MVLALMPPARPYRGAPVGRLGLLGGAQVVEMAAVRACADGAIQAHGALAWLLGLALARPHVQTWEERKHPSYHRKQTSSVKTFVETNSATLTIIFK